MDNNSNKIEYGNQITLKKLWRGKREFLVRPKKLLLYPVIKKCTPYSMLNYAAFSQMYDAIKTLDKEHVKGSIVEAGCWKGGGVFSWL